MTTLSDCDAVRWALRSVGDLIAESALVNRQAQAGCAARISAIPVCSPAASSEKRLAGRRIRRQQGGGSGLSERLSLHIYMPFYLWKRRWVMSTAATLSATCACMRAPSCRVAWKVTDTVRQRA